VNPYQILNVQRNASAETVRTAYLRLAHQWHPDLNRHDPQQAREQFKRVRHAYEILRKPFLRDAYDRNPGKPIRTPANSSPVATSKSSVAPRTGTHDAPDQHSETDRSPETDGASQANPNHGRQSHHGNPHKGNSTATIHHPRDVTRGPIWLLRALSFVAIAASIGLIIAALHWDGQTRERLRLVEEDTATGTSTKQSAPAKSKNSGPATSNMLIDEKTASDRSLSAAEATIADFNTIVNNAADSTAAENHIPSIDPFAKNWSRMQAALRTLPPPNEVAPISAIYGSPSDVQLSIDVAHWPQSQLPSDIEFGLVSSSSQVGLDYKEWTALKPGETSDADFDLSFPDIGDDTTGLVSIFSMTSPAWLETGFSGTTDQPDCYTTLCADAHSEPDNSPPSITPPPIAPPLPSPEESNRTAAQHLLKVAEYHRQSRARTTWYDTFSTHPRSPENESDYSSYRAPPAHAMWGHGLPVADLSSPLATKLVEPKLPLSARAAPDFPSQGFSPGLAVGPTSHPPVPAYALSSIPPAGHSALTNTWRNSTGNSPTTWPRPRGIHDPDAAGTNHFSDPQRSWDHFATPRPHAMGRSPQYSPPGSNPYGN